MDCLGFRLPIVWKHGLLGYLVCQLYHNIITLACFELWSSHLVSLQVSALSRCIKCGTQPVHQTPRKEAPSCGVTKKARSRLKATNNKDGNAEPRQKRTQRQREEYVQSQFRKEHGRNSWALVTWKAFWLFVLSYSERHGMKHFKNQCGENGQLIHPIRWMPGHFCGL